MDKFKVQYATMRYGKEYSQMQQLFSMYAEKFLGQPIEITVVECERIRELEEENRKLKDTIKLMKKSKLTSCESCGDEVFTTLADDSPICTECDK